MATKIPDFSESIADGQGKASRNWFNFWKALSVGVTSGSFTFATASMTIAFPTPMPSTNYNVFFDNPIGSPTWATSKTVNGFTTNSVGVGSTLTFVGWSAIRR